MTDRELIDGATLRFDVIGTPVTQGSKNRGARGQMYESSKALRPWRDSVAWTARAALAGRFGWPAGHPVVVSVVFWLQRPKSAPKRIVRPATRPDVDKLLRSLFDALKDSGVVHDDGQIVSVYVDKCFAPSGRPLGATVTVSEVAS